MTFLRRHRVALGVLVVVLVCAAVVFSYVPPARDGAIHIFVGGGTTTTTTSSSTTTTTTSPGGGGAPSSGTVICGTSVLDSPYSSSNSATALGSTTTVVDVSSSTFSSTTWTATNTTFYIAPGSYTVSEQIKLGNNDWLVGEYSGGTGVTLSGNFAEQYGILTEVGATDTVEYLTVAEYETYAVGYGWNSASPYPTGAPGGLTLKYSTLEDNMPGSGADLGSGDVVEDNCMTDNGDYGFNAYCTVVDAGAGCPTYSTMNDGPENITVEDNEISWNDECNWTEIPAANFPLGYDIPTECGSGCTGSNSSYCGPGYSGCGCAGGAHFWNSVDTIFDDNYVHDNYYTGSWWDTDNDGEQIEGNYFANNWSQATDLEISYNALIEDNAYVDNGWGEGSCGSTCGVGSNLVGAIYLSESGGSSAAEVADGYTTIDIADNTFTNNWDGVQVYESSDRFCSSPDNTSTGYCTLGANNTSYWGQSAPAPTTTYYANDADTAGGCGEVNLTGATSSGSPDYWDNCLWKATNITVSGNTFSFSAAAITGGDATSACSTSASSPCGENGIFSQDASGISWSPYQTPQSYVIPDSMDNCVTGFDVAGCESFNNYFSDNTYSHTGSQAWQFMWNTIGNSVSLSTWQGYGQDSGSSGS